MVYLYSAEVEQALTRGWLDTRLDSKMVQSQHDLVNDTVPKKGIPAVLSKTWLI